MLLGVLGRNLGTVTREGKTFRKMSREWYTSTKPQQKPRDKGKCGDYTLIWDGGR